LSTFRASDAFPQRVLHVRRGLLRRRGLRREAESAPASRGSRLAALFIVLTIATLVGTVSPGAVREAAAQTSPVSPAPVVAGAQYRAFFVDTYNTPLNNGTDVAAVITHAQAANANVLLAQVRRRGDAWYLDTSEPTPDGVSFADGFDPLRELLTQAHAAGIQVHAWVVLGAIWSQLTLPASPQHVFAQHGFTGAGLVPGRANWLTRTLQPDGALTSASGYRFGTDFWLDFGHPDAAAYTASVVNQLVAQYDIDGLHLDRLQYPDPTNTGATPPPGASVLAGGTASVGYNEVSLARFRHRYGLTAEATPGADDAAWSDWRRAQVSALMRRIYLETIASKPQIQVSAGLVATGNSPSDDDQWNGTDAASHAFQDWRAWLEEGILDIAVPLNFRQEHQAANADAFNGWLAWTRGHAYQRMAIIGLGAYENAIEGTLRQIRRTIEVVNGSTVPGVAIYSMGAHNAPVNDNPFAVPSQRDTPYRVFDDLASGLKNGKTASGQPLESRAGPGVFAAGSAPALATLAWKSAPQTGHVKGIVRHGDGQPVDTADITIDSIAEGGTSAATTTDGNGFYGHVGLAPGTYRVSVMPSGDGRYISTCTIDIVAGSVSTLDLMVDTSRPSTATCTTISSPSRSHLR
jgi:uncharacterized lipoprotein YddW (UPF0748 family)